MASSSGIAAIRPLVNSGQMATVTKRLSLTKDHFEVLRKIICENSGIFFASNQGYLLELRLGGLISKLGMSSFGEYINYLRDLRVGSPVFREIYSAIAISETYFFRYQAQPAVFRSRISSDLIVAIKAGKQFRLSLLSAACSSGEELYSLVIIVGEVLGPWIDDWSLRLLGTDISQESLDKARQAVYPNSSFRRSMAEADKSRYFKEDGNGFALDADIKKMARFRYLNLNDDFALSRLPKFDFIFCRNVLIYFDRATKKRITHSLYGLLNHGGYLFLGEAESLHGLTGAYQVQHFPGAFAYQKE